MSTDSKEIYQHTFFSFLHTTEVEVDTNFVSSCCVSPIVSCRFRPSVPVEYVQSSLAFPCLDTCLTFLTGLGVLFVQSDPNKIDCKASSACLTA